MVLGRSGEGLVPYLPVGGGLFAAFVGTSITYHVLLESLVPGWPLMNSSTIIGIGDLEIPHDVVSHAVSLVVAAVGLEGSLVAARRERGLLVSLVLASAPVVGLQARATIYFQSPFFGFQFGSPSEWFGGVAFGVLVGIPPGILGFWIGRTFELIGGRGRYSRS